MRKEEGGRRKEEEGANRKLHFSLIAPLLKFIFVLCQGVCTSSVKTNMNSERQIYPAFVCSNVAGGGGRRGDQRHGSKSLGGHKRGRKKKLGDPHFEES